MKKLLGIVIPKKYTELIAETAKKAEALGASFFYGDGTAGKLLLDRLGLGKTKKTVLCVLTDEKHCTAVYKNIQEAALQAGDCLGILFTILTEKNPMTEKSAYSVICAIVNSGCGHIAMQAARKAGAEGGTLVEARGTGTEQDMNFFGIQIMPEKEMLIIVTEQDKVEKITNAIKLLPSLAKAGSGIIFTLEADNCIHLGSKE